MNKGPTYFHQPPAGVPQPQNSPYQPGYTGVNMPGAAQPTSYTGYQQSVQRQGAVPAPQQPQANYAPYQPQPYGAPYAARPAQGGMPQGYSPYQQNPQGMQPQGYTAYQQSVQGMQPQFGAPGQQPYYMNMTYQQPQPWQGQNQQPYPRQGYPYQVNGVVQNGMPPQGMQPVAPVPPPQPRPVRPSVDVEGVSRLAVYVALPLLVLLFVLGMAVSALAWMKWAYVGLAALVMIMLWVRPLLRDDIKITLSCIMAALAVVAVVSALTGAPADKHNDPAAAASPQGGTSAMATMLPQSQSQSGLSIPQETQPPQMAVTPTPPPVSSGMQSEAVERMDSFLYFWSVNNIDSMYTLCAPSWVKKQTEPMVALYSILANRTPVDHNATAISGTDNDLSRTITVTINLHRNNGIAPKTYLFKIIMLREDGVWYVDPSSLVSNEEATATPASAEITQMPTPAPVADARQVLYWNPDGGSYYHLDNYCKSANARNLPFKGSFTYSQLNDPQYKDLIACPVCAAPKRPSSK